MRVWAVVPAKPFGQAKQRLAGVLRSWERETLARLMLHDTLDALRAVPGLAGRLVVSADPAVAALARPLGAELLHEARPEGLNAAIALAADEVRRRGADAMLVVPGDVPGLQAADLRTLIERHPAPGIGRAALSLVPAHDGDGTNAWLLSPPEALAPAFGPASFVRHQRLAQAAGLAVHCRALPRLGLDLDQPSDLARYLAEPGHAGTRTARFLRERRARLEAWARGSPPSLSPPRFALEAG